MSILVVAFGLFLVLTVVQKDNVTAYSGPELGVCTPYGGTGDYCGSDGDCAATGKYFGGTYPLTCVGGNGTCGSGTCQPLVPSTGLPPPPSVDPDPGEDFECGGVEYECNSNSDCDNAPNGSPDTGSCNFFYVVPGCMLGFCSYPVCTTGVPNPPSYLTSYFVGPTSLEILIPPYPQNGTGDSHHVKVVLATQNLDEVTSPLKEWYYVDKITPEHSVGFQYIAMPNGDPIEVPVKVGVRNWDNCQQIWGPWREASPIDPYEPPDGGGEGQCTGAIPSSQTLCPGDDQNIGTNDIPYTLYGSCSSPVGSAPKCQTTCASGFTYSNGTCEPDIVAPQEENGNVFGFAWSSNIGWIKMNACSDIAPFDGVADAGSCSTPSFGVKVNNNDVMGGPGDMSGHAWSPSVGWIAFGGNNTADMPTPAQAPGTVQQNAFLSNVTGASGELKGWAKVLTGGSTPGFDGWISMSGTNYQTGAAYTNGSAGSTYHPPTAKIVGHAWAGDVLGWISFSGTNYKTTYGKPGDFNYHLVANPLNITIDKGSTDTVSVSRVLDGGVEKDITLSATILNPNGYSVIPSVTNISPATCPTCESTITISVPANAQHAFYTMKVTGVPQDDVTTDSPEEVNVTIIVPSGGAGGGPITASCEAQGVFPYRVNNPITWTSENVTGGTPPYSYEWSGTDGLSGTGPSVVKTYSTTGIKTASLVVSDSAVPQNETTVLCTQPQTGGDQIIIIVQPDIIEF